MNSVTNKTNVLEFSVSEFSRSLKYLLEDNFGYVRLRGEIIGLKKASSGHIYFNLKDGDSTINAVYFKNFTLGNKLEIKDGMQVVASGKITNFESRSNYQIIVEKVEMLGIGALMEMIENRKQKLAKEGLFDDVHKKKLPLLPQTIGVITSETGSVIEDIKHRISDRFPTSILLYPALVQGEHAAKEVIAGIKFFNNYHLENKPNVIIIARGGGSFEDLMPFNDEDLVREIFKSKIPIISAIGHETDFTLCDYVSDLRAPTPTAAAEIATPILKELKYKYHKNCEQIVYFVKNYFDQKKIFLSNTKKSMDLNFSISQKQKYFSIISNQFDLVINNFFQKKERQLSSIKLTRNLIKQRIENESNRVLFSIKTINSKILNSIKHHESNLDNLRKMLHSNHYNNILKRGFALLKTKDEKAIISSSFLQTQESITIEMHDGKTNVKIVK